MVFLPSNLWANCPGVASIGYPPFLGWGTRKPVPRSEILIKNLRLALGRIPLAGTARGRAARILSRHVRAHFVCRLDRA